MEIELKPIMPKEHGLWAWVFLPLLVGAGCATGGGERFFFVLPAVFFWFLALTPARMIYKNAKRDIPQNKNTIFWVAVYAIAGSAMTLLAMVMDLWLGVLFVLLSPAFYLAVRASYSGFQRKRSFEFGGIFFLSLGSLLGAYSVAGTIGMYDLGVWLLLVVFLLDRNVESRSIVRAGDWFSKPPSPPENLPLVLRINLLLAFFSLVGVSAVFSFFPMNRELIFAFIPGILTTLYYNVSPPRTLKRVGYSELALTFIFGIGFVLLSGIR